MKDYSCELGAACGPEAAAGRELAAVRKRRCVAEEAQVAGEGDELLLLLFVRAVVRDDAHLFGYVGEARHLIASGRLGAADVLPRFGRERHSITPPRRVRQRVERVLLLRPDLLEIVAERVGAKRFIRRRLAPPRRHELAAPAAAPRERCLAEGAIRAVADPVATERSGGVKVK